MNDIWVCSTCHSINRQRNDRCYKCGERQTEATGALADLRVETAIATRTVIEYRSAWLRAFVASVLILAFAAMGIILLLASLDDYWWVRDQVPVILSGGTFDEPEFLRRTGDLVVPALLHTGIAIAALVMFAAWLSRVTSNIPALGGGVPGTSPTKAFIYPLIPLLNLVKVPSMIQDAMYRVDPKAGGFFMIALAWFGLVGSWLISFVVGWWVNIRIATAPFSVTSQEALIGAIQDAFDLQFMLDVVTTCMVSAGAVVLVLVIMRIERRASARDAEIRAAAELTGDPAEDTIPAGVVADAG